MTVKELEQNLKEIMSNASESARKKLADAKVVGIACDVCKPEDVEKLSNFAVKELGSINIWVKNIFHLYRFFYINIFSLISYIFHNCLYSLDRLTMLVLTKGLDHCSISRKKISDRQESFTDLVVLTYGL